MTAVSAARARIGVVLVVALLVQTTLGSDLRVDGVAPDLLLLVSICAGLVGGARAGATVGFFAGLLADLSLTTTPLGLSALSWCLVGWIVGALRVNYLPDARSLQPVIGLVSTALGVILFLVAGGLAGQGMLSAPGHAYLERVVVIEALWNAILIVPVAFVYGLAARGSKGVASLGRTDAAVVP
jgi:rod shape-determining protein MreD